MRIRQRSLLCLIIALLIGAFIYGYQQTVSEMEDYQIVYVLGK